MAEIALIRSKANNIIHEIPVDSEAYRRCKQHPNEYEDVTKLKHEAAKAAPGEMLGTDTKKLKKE